MTKMEKKAYEMEALADVARMFSDLIKSKYNECAYYTPNEDEADNSYQKEMRDKFTAQAEYIEELAVKMFK